MVTITREAVDHMQQVNQLEDLIARALNCDIEELHLRPIQFETVKDLEWRDRQNLLDLVNKLEELTGECILDAED